MRLQQLISAVDQIPAQLVDKMNVNCDAVLINQCDHFGYEEIRRGGYLIRAYSLKEKGVGLSRNNALMRADGDLCLFSDEDIIYEDGYEKKIIGEFERHPEADMLLFNVEVCEARRTYHNDAYERVRLYNCGRYPAYSFAMRTETVHRKNICYSLLFGGGARYSNGEDSLFIRDCIRSGMRVYKTPVTIGREQERESTWFSGYHEKFFFDRGVLYEHLYGRLAKPVAMRFLLAHRAVMCREIPVKKAYELMCQGLKEARK
ncbi:glycosyltransferase family A protein [Lachnospiraceae bacterium JLR.KK008]